MDDDLAAWWRTSIIDMAPGRIAIRGTPIEDLIGHATFTEMVWRMTRADAPTPAQARLLEAALVAGVDHGPQAPSVAAARMAATCGVGLQSAMATGANMLGDVHGGAGAQCAAMLYEMDGARDVAAALAGWRARNGPMVPGYGHRFHRPVDPRAPRLMALVREAAAAGEVPGRFADLAEAVQGALGAARGVPIAMNVDGAAAAVCCELGFPAPLARGLFVLSRSVGLLAHAWEQTQQGGRNKGPMPPRVLPRYDGPLS